MLNWTEEDVNFVAEKIMVPLLVPYTELLANEMAKLDEMSDEINSKVFNIVADRIREIDYEKNRDRTFFLSYLGKLDRLFDVNKIYKNFCEEYDKHNKHLLDTKSKVELK